MKTFLTTAVMTAALSLPAGAATFDFDNGGDQGNHASIVETVGNVTVTVTSDSDTGGSEVTWRDKGLGVETLRRFIGDTDDNVDGFPAWKR